MTELADWRTGILACVVDTLAGITTADAVDDFRLIQTNAVV